MRLLVRCKVAGDFAFRFLKIGRMQDKHLQRFRGEALKQFCSRSERRASD